MIEHAWVFKEKAIETVFDRLMIAGSQANVEDQDDDAFIEAMPSSGFDAQGQTEKEGKVGQIVVELRRIILGEKRTEANYRSHHQEGQDEDIDMGVRPDITHGTGFLRQNTPNHVPLRVVDYCKYIRFAISYFLPSPSPKSISGADILFYSLEMFRIIALKT